MSQLLIDHEALERLPTVANCRMNREREIRGTNSYAADLGWDPVDYLAKSLQRQDKVAWLDLCCGTGRALIQAAECFRGLGLANRVNILGIDLVNMFDSVPEEINCLTLHPASVHCWTPGPRFDLVTCVHGLHYVGDKLALIARAASWLQPDGIFMAHLDLDNVKLVSGRRFAPQLGRHFKRLGLRYDRRRRVLSCQGTRRIDFPFHYVGADDEAGPNFTRQPAIDSYYTATVEL